MRSLPLRLALITWAAGAACSSDPGPADTDQNWTITDARADGGVSALDAAVNADASDTADTGVPAPDATVDPQDAEVTPDVMHNGDFERDPTRINLRGACPQEDRIGGFSVQMNEDVGYTAFDGVVRNGIIPNAVRDVTAEEGGCRLLRRRRLTCDPPCGAGETCGVTQMCVPSPVGQSMGPVRVFGLERNVDVMPQQPGQTYFYTRLRHPGVAENAVVQLTAPMPTYFAPLEMYGVGVRRVEPLDAEWVLTDGEPLAIHWVPPAADARTSVYIELNIDLHGLTPLLLVCDVPDTGTATVSANIIRGFIANGVTGFPEGRVTRRTGDSITRPEGCVDFTVSSTRRVELEVTGFIPCTGPAECPAPLTCDVAIQQCR